MSKKSNKHVFISSATHSDREWLRRLTDALVSHGLRPWLDERELVPGEHRERRLEEELRKADAILFVLTGDASERTNVFFELGFAKGLGKQSIFIVPKSHNMSWVPPDLRGEELVSKKSPEETAAALAAVLQSNLPPETTKIGPEEHVPFRSNDLSLGHIEFATNPEPKLPCVLMLDTSGSMAGKPITKLNAATATFISALKQDEIASRRTDLTILSFGAEVCIEQEFSLPDMIQLPALKASGTTPMGQALRNAIEMVTQRKQFYRRASLPYYRPWIILITDGSPTDAWQEVAQRVREGVVKKEFFFFAVGVEGADMEMLANISPVNTPPLKLRGLDFEAFFSWLSSSLAQVSSSSLGNMVRLPSINWAVDA